MTSIITEGNAGTDAELRYTHAGKAYATVTLIVNDRTKNSDGEWVDGATSSYRVTVWGSPAESFAASVTKGARLIVAGELTVREYTDREGQQRLSREISAEHAGLSTRFHTLTGHKTEPHTTHPAA
jgi:single-strand DNA-binding protein